MSAPRLRCGCVLSMVFLLPIAPSFAQIIDHTSVDGVASLPQATMDAIGAQKWFFTHASVGGNMLEGMADLNASNPTRYQLLQASVGFNSSLDRADNPPPSTVAGTIYECDRGNPGWAEKIAIFQNSVNFAGWRSPATPIAMNKFCFIDQDANFNQYLNSMAALEATWPATTFVYSTMPLTTDEDDSNILRNNFNAEVRNYCRLNGRLLFDIADIESYCPLGIPSTFILDSRTYQRLYVGYSLDGGHLGVIGRQRIALGWYAVAAAIVSETSSDSGDTSDNGSSNGDTPTDSSVQPCGVCGPGTATMMPAMLFGWSRMKQRRRRTGR
jgi:hypothetical protein